MTPLDIESLREHRSNLTNLEKELLDTVVELQNQSFVLLGSYRRITEERDELTRQLDDARDKAINAGIFTSSDGDESKYTHALNTETCEGCGRNLVMEYCYRCETETSTPGATSYKP